MLRIIDANINRVCEGLRVIEDIVRFEFNDSLFSESLKEIRHKLRKIFYSTELLIERDSINDCGKNFSQIESYRNSIFDLLKANFLRAEEGLRTIEESIKFEKKFEKNIDNIKCFRFTLYDLEKKILIKYNKINKLKNFAIIDLNKDFNTITEYIQKNSISSILLNINNIDLELLKRVRNFCIEKDVLCFVKNSLDLAIIINTDGIIIDNNYYGIEEIKPNYKKLIGGIGAKELLGKEYDFIIIEDIKIIDYFVDIEKPLLIKEEDYNKLNKNYKVNICKRF